MPSFTINITTAQTQRIKDAFTFAQQPVDANGDPREADVADVKAYVVFDLKKFVTTAERQKAQRDYVGDEELDLT